MFFLNCILLGIGLAMDSFSVSLADGLHENGMRTRRMCLIAGVFFLFHGAMPMIGWVIVHQALQYLVMLEKLIPWIALIALGIVGAGMIFESRHPEAGIQSAGYLGIQTLLYQGVATSIDTLSVGFTISGYNLTMALLASLIIACVTFIASLIGLSIGKRFGTHIADKAELFGGVILILIGIEICMTGVLG